MACGATWKRLLYYIKMVYKYNTTGFGDFNSNC